jgi:hypothetical protein
MKGWIDYLTKISITLAVVGFLMSFAISCRSYGLAEGLTIGEQELEVFKTKIGYDTIRLSGGIGGTYDHFAIDYFWLLILFGVCGAVLILIRSELHIYITITGYVLSGSAVLLLLYKLRILIRDKAFVDQQFWEAPRNAFAHSTVTYDWILITITFLLIVSQLNILILQMNKKIATDKSTRV